MSKNNLEQRLMDLTAKNYKSPNQRTGQFGIAYTRVSTQEQAQNNGSLETQIKLAKDFSERNGINIVEFFGGKYESAKTDGRKEFQRMIEYAIKNKNITYIIVSNYDRFSRTGSGAAKLSEDLRIQHGIIVKSVTQDFDTSTATGRLQENFMHMLNNFDNVMKSDRTKLHTKEVMEKGYWPYTTPFGYDNLKKKQRACFHEYVINEQGKQLKKGFLLKAEGKMSNKEIIDYLRLRGANITEKNFRLIFSNPFYAGYITGKLLEGRMVKGKHPALIDLKTFLKANDMLSINPIAGIPKVFRHENLPLKIFAKDEISGEPLTGYRQKNNWYYKTKSTATPVNIKAEKLNQLFENQLKQYEYRNDQKGALKKLLSQKIINRLANTVEENKLRKKKISEKRGQLEKIEKKYLLDEIDKEMYEKHAGNIKHELSNLEAESNYTEINSSNLEKAIEKCLIIAQNLSRTWVTANFEQKRILQQLIFPEGILYNKEKYGVRTLKVNSLFQPIPYLQRIIADNKKGNLLKDCLNSSKVPRTGIEPALPCDNQILSLARLPIPPSGLLMH